MDEQLAGRERGPVERPFRQRVWRLGSGRVVASRIEPETLIPLVAFGTLAVLVVVGLILAQREQAKELARGWTGTIVRVETRLGRVESRPGAGGSVIIDPKRRFALVFFRRDDGVEAAVSIGEPGPYMVQAYEEGQPDFHEVLAQWAPGQRVQKPAGSHWPRRVSSA